MTSRRWPCVDERHQADDAGVARMGHDKRWPGQLAGILCGLATPAQAEVAMASRWPRIRRCTAASMTTSRPASSSATMCVFPIHAGPPMLSKRSPTPAYAGSWAPAGLRTLWASPSEQRPTLLSPSSPAVEITLQIDTTTLDEYFVDVLAIIFRHKPGDRRSTLLTIMNAQRAT